MTKSNSPVGLFSFIFQAPIKLISIIILGLFLVSCGEEIVRTESEYIDIATEAHAAGNSRLAIFELAASIRNYPNNAELQILRGKIFLDLEDGTAAEIAFNKAISLGYNRDFIKHEIAESWLYQRNPGKIIENLEKEILQGSKDALIYEIVGRAYIASRDPTNATLFMKNMNTAKGYIEEAFQLNPNSTRVLITKAWISALAGKIDEALEWLDKADAIVKDQRQNLAVKGELLVRQNKIDPAQETYGRLVKKFPQYPQYKLELGYTYLLNKDYAKSREWIEPIAKQYPNQLRAKYLLANVSLMQRRFKTAKQLSADFLVISPDNLQAIIVNGASSYFLGDFENAHQKLNHFYNRTGSVPALKLLVATKLKLNEDVDAAKLLEDAGQITEKQTDVELLNLVAIASAKIGKIDVALEAYKKLAEQQPGTPSFKSNVGLIQIAQGNYDEGFKNLEQALKEKEDEAEIGLGLYYLANQALQIGQYDRAADYIEQYKEIAGDDYKPWVQSAVLQSLLKNYPAVHRDFAKALEIAPNVAEVKARYAIFEDRQGNQEKAQALAHEALKLDPSDIGAGELILEQLIKDKKFDEVKIIIDRAITDDQASGARKLFFADYYTLLGRPQETLNVLGQLSDSLKELPAYQIISGKAYLRNGQAQRAVSILERLTLRSPNNIMALKPLLHGYLLTRDQGKYLSTLEKIDSLQPRDYENQITLAKLYITTEKYDQAEKTLNTIIPINPQQELQMRFVLAGLETKRQNFKKAQDILAALNDQYPKHGNVAMLYARNLANDGQIEKAIKISTTWAELNPTNLDVKRFLGDLYMRNQDNESARLQYESIVTSDNRVNTELEFHAHNNLAIIYLNDNQDQKAMEHAQKALDMAPNNPAVVDTYAQILLKQDQPGQAIVHFNQALALLPTKDRINRSIFSLGKAKALIQTGQIEQAKRILDRLVKDDPEFPQIDEVKRLLAGLL